MAFLKGEATIGVRKNVPEAAPTTPPTATNRYTVRVNDRAYDVVLDGGTALVDGHSYTFDVAAGTTSAESAPAPTTPTPVGTATEVRAQLPGKVLRLAVAEGDTVKAGDALLVLEALKMEIEVSSPVDGTVTHLAVEAQETVVAGDLLVAVE